jgi:hypothetical protein
MHKHIQCFLFLFCFFAFTAHADEKFSYRNWTLIYNVHNSKVELLYKQKPVLTDIEAQAKCGQVMLFSKDYSKVNFATSSLKDSFGEGLLVTISHTTITS